MMVLPHLQYAALFNFCGHASLLTSMTTTTTKQEIYKYLTIN